jgi:oligopeptide transport system substrate-binding protein
MNKRTIVFSLMAILVTLSLIFTSACGSDDGKPKPGSLKDPQEITLNLAGEVNTIDPNRASWSNERSVIMQCFDGMLAFDHDLKLVPMVAKEIPTVANKGISADGKTYTFKMRTDVTWSDGEKVTAKDFEYSIKRMLNPDLAAEYASFYFAIVGAEEYYSATEATEAEKTALRDAVGVKATGDYTLEIKLDDPLPTFINLMALWPAYPVRQDVIEEFGETWTSPPNYIGNGPFVLQEWVQQDHYIFVRNENYWGTKPYLTKITYKEITDANVALAAYRNNELDQSGVPGGTEKATMADASISPEIVRKAQLVTYAFQFNVTKEPYNNKTLRQALATAIDRVAYIDKIRGGIGTPAVSWIPPGMPGYDPELGKQYTFDATKAKQLLTQAGYTDPKTLQIKFQYANTGANPTIAAFLQAQMKDNLGVDLTLEPMDPKAYSALYNAKQFDWGFTGWGADYPDPDNWLPQLYMTDAGNNKTGYSSAEFDAVSRQALKELNETKRLQLWADAHKIVVEDCPMAYVFNRETFFLKKPWVKGQFVSGMDGSLPGDMFLREVYIEK